MVRSVGFEPTKATYCRARPRPKGESFAYLLTIAYVLYTYNNLKSMPFELIGLSGRNRTCIYSLGESRSIH